MPSWLTKALQRIHQLAKERRVLFTLKALEELEALELGLDEEDVCSVLEDLSEEDFEERISCEQTEEWLFVFKPIVAVLEIYLKVVLRNSCIVISFHEDEPDER